MRHTPQKPNPRQAVARALPDGWTMSAKGLWHHENGARVEFTASTPKYRMTDADGTYATADTRAEAFAWASGEVP